MNNPIMHPPHQRPIGVSIISIIIALNAILTLISAFTWLFGIGLLGFQATGDIRGFALWYGLISAILGVALAYFSWSLWTLQRWSFYTIIILEILNIVAVLATWAQGFMSFWTFFLSLLLPTVILVYFLADRRVRAAFGV